MPNYTSFDSAKSILPIAERIQIIGCSGGGKSTLAGKISMKYDLEHIPIDREVRWLPGWVARSKVEQREIFEKLVQRERWVMDGTSPSSFDIRLPRTDLVIWIRVPRRVALAGVAGRVVKNIGRTRPDMAEGCKEKLPDIEFLSYIWNFEKKSVSNVTSQLDQFGPKVPVLVLNSRREINSFIGTSKNR